MSKMELTGTELEIIKGVCQHFGLNQQEVCHKGRKRELVEARHLLILIFVIELSHDIHDSTSQFGCKTSNFYHGLTCLVNNYRYNKGYREKISSLFPINGITEEDFINKIVAKHSQLENDKAAARY